MLEQYQMSNHFLQQVNPTMKLVSMLLIIFYMITVFDPYTPLILLVLTVCVIRLFGGVPLKFLLLILLPSLLALFGLMLFFLRGTTILFTIGSMPVALENVLIGVSLGLRSLVFASWSLLFVLTTDPTRFMLSLIQHCKLPPRFGYGMMAAYRFIPLFKQELNQVRAAHKIRGLGEPRGIKERIIEIKRYSIPLLASAIRKAERVAIAMESKGFDGNRNRTYYHVIRWSKADLTFGMGILFVFASLYLIRVNYLL